MKAHDIALQQFACALCSVEIEGPFTEYPAHCGQPAIPMGNIRLAAAAPELLDACEAVMAECLDLPPSVLNQLARAIAKARGEQ